MGDQEPIVEKCGNGACMGHGVKYVLLDNGMLFIRCVQCVAQYWSSKPVFDSYDAAMVVKVKMEL